jgi:hypothetical protein
VGGPDSTGVNALPLKSEGTVQLNRGLEEFDVSSVWESDAPSQRTIQLVGGTAGAIVLVLGILIVTVFPLGSGSPTIGQRVIAPSALILLGGSFLVIAVYSIAFQDKVAKVLVDDDSVRLVYNKGRVSEVRWNDPRLRGSIMHAVRIPPTDGLDADGWVLFMRGTQSKLSDVVTLEAGNAIVNRAKAIGVETCDIRNEVKNRGGLLIFEGTKFQNRPP